MSPTGSTSDLLFAFYLSDGSYYDLALPNGDNHFKREVKTEKWYKVGF